MLILKCAVRNNILSKRRRNFIIYIIVTRTMRRLKTTSWVNKILLYLWTKMMSSLMMIINSILSWILRLKHSSWLTIFYKILTVINI
jgi:hypothetical protein